MNGFLLIDKPEGITSAACVYKLRDYLGIKRIGHCGTLDPLATGLLPICIGEATKFSNYMSNLNKTYEVTIQFGIETDTGDILGNIVSEDKRKVSRTKLTRILTGLIGKQVQLPPMFSAVRFNGKPLYYWARKGVFLRRNSREIVIYDADLLWLKNNKAKLTIACSKGTYIRTIVESIGRHLSTKATVSTLRRIKVGNMESSQMVHMPFRKTDTLFESILPSDFALSHYEKVILTKNDIKKVKNGQSIDYNAQLEKKGLVRIYTDKSLFVGLGEIDSSNKLSPKRLLATN